MSTFLLPLLVSLLPPIVFFYFSFPPLLSFLHSLLALSFLSLPLPFLTTSSSPRPFHSSSCYIIFSIIEMRQALRTQLEQMGSKLPWNHITDQIGMFCFTGISTPQVGTSSFIFLPWSYRNRYLNIRCDKFLFFSICLSFSRTPNAPFFSACHHHFLPITLFFLFFYVPLLLSLRVFIYLFPFSRQVLKMRELGIYCTERKEKWDVEIKEE